MAYYIMPRYGHNLQQILMDRQYCLPNVSIFHVGLAILNVLELIHNSGLVFNDLKPDNILVEYGRNFSKYDRQVN